ncbi:MAG: hypothetical protein IT372_34870 [Polyangiaceae bacterium]|nr:hypothetical protein [Polyangiaceae bacterium]
MSARTPAFMAHLRSARRGLSIGAAACGAALAAGCAGPTAREVLIDHYATVYVYHHPTAEVEAGVHRLLEDRGFQIRPIRRGDAIQTEWKLLTGTEEVATMREQYYVVVRRLTKEHSRVTAMRLEYSSVGMESYHPTVPYHDGPDGSKANTRSDERGWSPLQFAKPRARRDAGLEWELIRRVDPERARRIEATVDEALRERGAAAR